MGQLTLEHLPGRDLVIFTGIGRLLGRQVVEANRWREANCPTNLTLWDLRDADMSEITLPEIRDIVEGLVAQAVIHERRRTALVMDDRHNLPIARLYAQVAEYRNLPIDSHVYDSMSDACVWLGIDPPPLNDPDKVLLSF